MTVIAWDGKTLAADRTMTRGGTIYTGRKVFRVGSLLIGLAGGSDHCAELMVWIKGGRNPAAWPAVQRTEDFTCALVIEKGKSITYDRTPYPVVMRDRFTAIGTGREVALGAMYMGATAKQAVEAASRFIVDCGNGIDTLELRP